jgi:L-iditol 2-dehydrogenase
VSATVPYRRVVVDAPERLRVETAALPTEVPAGHARLRPAAIGICGSDLHVLGGHHPFVSYPVYPGHEVVGEVVAVGAGVDRGWVGRAVALEPSLACGVCRTCRRGKYHLCENLRVMGFQAPGAMAELADVLLDRLHPLPDGMPMEHGALVEPLAVATHALRLAGDVAGADVVVFGAGTIGLACAAVARQDGARMLVVDTDDARRRIAAERFGFEVAPTVAEQAYDVALECVGVEGALRDAIAAVVKAGTVMVIGVHGHDPAIQAGWVQDRELRLQGTLMYQTEDVQRAIELLADGRVDAGAWIDARVPLEEAQRGYDLARTGGATLKVLLVP